MNKLRLKTYALKSDELMRDVRLETTETPECVWLTFYKGTDFLFHTRRRLLGHDATAFYAFSTASGYDDGGGILKTLFELPPEIAKYLPESLRAGVAVVHGLEPMTAA